jgi:hypothetical protein
MSQARAYRHYLIRMGETSIALSKRNRGARRSRNIVIFSSLAALVVLSGLVILFSGNTRHSVLDPTEDPTADVFASEMTSDP